MTKPFGLWPSPITPRSMAGSLRLNDVQWDSDGTTLVWSEGRSDMGVLVAAPADGSQAPRDLTVELSVRAKVGYGGGEFTVGGGQVYFVEAKSGRLYRQALAGGRARPITPAFGNAAAPALSPDGSRLLYVHSYEGRDVIALVDAAGKGWPQQLVSGHDFYMQPTWHPDGQQFAYVAWNHPLMPWDGATLYLATVNGDGKLEGAREIAGGSDESVFQPAFSPDGRFLAYVSDAGGQGQVWLCELASGTRRALTSGTADYGQPAWVQGMRTLAWSHDSQQIYALPNAAGFRTLVALPVAGGPARPIALGDDYSWPRQPAASPTDGRMALLASGSTQPERLITVDGEQTRVFRRTTTENVTPGELTPARAVTWESAGGVPVHGLLYLPRGFEPGATLAPPAIVRIHGGPTSQAVSSYNDGVQFFTTRGYTVLDVNYRGSTGYGRDYMLTLRGNWGICDVEDAVSGAQFLAAQGYADGGRMVIMGGSAGGYTVLEALCRAPGVFRAGLCLYGVSNMFALAADTHKFEERYLDSLLGPLPEASAIYRERSPLFHAELLRDPIAIFQGEEDTVVPRNQSDSIVESLRQRGVPHEYHVYPGEGHGWRKAETIETFFKAVDAFLQQYVVFG
ncbi:MAG: S9 family peptidase [Chloroflexaceae bacterium]|nr:S9 family peptidase [Chloroflexaceae bacterium]